LPEQCCRGTDFEYDPPQNRNTLRKSFHMSGTAPPSLAETLRLKLELNNTELRILCRLLTWGQLVHEQVCEVMADEHRSINGIIEQLRAKLKPYRIKISSINESEFELREGDRKKLIAFAYGTKARAKAKTRAKPKPTIAAKQIPSRPTEAAGAKSRRRVDYEPKSKQARAAAA
jgi:hypothetical protein